MSITPAKLPVTVLSGFLGAGKTTPLNHILANRDGLIESSGVSEPMPVAATFAFGRVAELNGGHIPETIEYGIASLLFRAPEPFHTQRLWDLLETAVTRYGMLRSKGFLWLATRPDTFPVWQVDDLTETLAHHH